MLLSVQEMVNLLRSSVNVQNSETGVVDSAFLDMKDSELELFIKLGTTACFPEIDSLEDLPEGSEYAVLLLAKIELYMKLAVLKADRVDMRADNNNELKLGQRFTHYMKLAEEARAQYDKWLDTGGASTVGGVRTFNVIRSKNHYSNYNYENGPVPKVRIKIESITNNSVEFRWSLSNYDHFGCYKVYIGVAPIVDMYREGNKAENKVTPDSTLIKRTINIHDVFHRVEGLEPDTTYYIAVFSIERNLLFGYTEKSFSTNESFIEEDELNINSL